MVLEKFSHSIFYAFTCRRQWYKVTSTLMNVLWLTICGWYVNRSNGLIVLISRIFSFAMEILKVWSSTPLKYELKFYTKVPNTTYFPIKDLLDEILKNKVPLEGGEEIYLTLVEIFAKMSINFVQNSMRSTMKKILFLIINQTQILGIIYQHDDMVFEVYWCK